MSQYLFSFRYVNPKQIRIQSNNTAKLLKVSYEQVTLEDGIECEYFYDQSQCHLGRLCLWGLKIWNRVWEIYHTGFYRSLWGRSGFVHVRFGFWVLELFRACRLRVRVLICAGL